MELALGILGTTLALLALAGERVKRPRLEIRPAEWEGTGKVDWDFLVIRVFNRPAPGWIGWLFSRRSAQACQISLTYQHDHDDRPAIDQIPGRWSAAPEPITWQGGQPQPDPSGLPQTYRHDVATTVPGEEIAVARTRNGDAYAFSSESYLYAMWRRPGWELRPGRWTLTVRAASSDARVDRTLHFTVGQAGELAWSEPAPK